jgi:hypothetical protein
MKKDRKRMKTRNKAECKTRRKKAAKNHFVLSPYGNFILIIFHSDST